MKSVAASRRFNTVWLGACSLVFVAIVYLITVDTLSFSLSHRDPLHAFELNHRNTDALVDWTSEQAGRLAEKNKQKEVEKITPAGPGVDLPNSPAPNKNAVSPKIGVLTRKLQSGLSADPINAVGLRLLGQLQALAGHTAKARQLAAKASDLSTHEILAHDLMFSASLDDKNYAQALFYANRLFSAAPSLLTTYAPVFNVLVHDETSRKALVELLLADPPWRPYLFNGVLPRMDLQGLESAASLFEALTAKEGHIDSAEQNALLKSLVAKKQIESAYAIWLRLLPSDRIDLVDLLNNGSFEADPSGAPFDWTISGGKDVNAKIGILPGETAKHGLNIEFGRGRVTFPQIYQFITLMPGRYRFEGQFKGEVSGRRGLQWTVTCADGKRSGESEAILGRAFRWQKIAFEFSTPKDGCSSQIIRLFHSARSLSEQLVSGSVWFDDLSIVRLDRESSAEQ